jgi:acetylornithine deacetylase/succinyl-diaminopimelate desuccinylase-like protein
VVNETVEEQLNVVEQRLASRWRDDLAAAISDFVRVPSVSPAFDPDWAHRGALDKAIELVASWLSATVPSATMHRLQLPGRTPVLICDIPAVAGFSTAEAVLVYGHLDKQPAGSGWLRTDPFEPLLSDGLLFGRGSGDDGYAPYLLGAVIAELEATGAPHPRVILLLETSEESSSVDLPSYLDAYGELLGEPATVICLDAFVPNHDRLWVTTSMRGIIVADLSVGVLQDGAHSGLAGGVVPSSFRILRQLLDRIELATTGETLLPELAAATPPRRHAQLLERQAALTAAPAQSLGLLPGVEPMQADSLGQLTAQCWAPSIAYVGVGGAPAVDDAGSVLRASTTVRLSIRLPPSRDPMVATAALAASLESDPPYRAQVAFRPVAAERGWLATLPTPADTFLESASRAGYAADLGWCAGGGTIPFLGMFSARYPTATTLPIGVLGPGSNPHGPDECLDLSAAQKLSVAVARLLVELAGAPA